MKYSKLKFVCSVQSMAQNYNSAFFREYARNPEWLDSYPK
jgi:hypothetical protein